MLYIKHTDFLTVQMFSFDFVFDVFWHHLNYDDIIWIEKWIEKELSF